MHPLLVLVPLCAAYVPSVHPHLARHSHRPFLRTSAILLADESEVERAQRRRDDEARRAEQDASFSGAELNMDMLKERVDLLETKETQLSEIKQMLRVMEAGVGIKFVGDDDEVLATAWVFVALNVAIALYAIKALLVDPFVASVGSL